MVKEKMEEMRSLLIYVKDGVSIKEALKNVKGWSFEELKIPGGFPYCLNDGSTKIVISIDAENIATTANVLPHDLEGNQNKANKALLRLKEDLNKSGIESVLTASDKELDKIKM